MQMPDSPVSKLVSVEPTPPRLCMAWLVMLRSSEDLPGNIVALRPQIKNPIRLGSNPETCDIVLPSNEISRDHSEFELDPSSGQLRISDLGSTNGTYIQEPGSSEVTVERGYLLTDGCRLRFADTVFIFRCLLADPIVSVRSGSG